MGLQGIFPTGYLSITSSIHSGNRLALLTLLFSKISSTRPFVLAAKARYAAPMAVVAALVAMAVITGSARMSGGAAAVIGNWSRSVVNVLHNSSLWRRGAVPRR